MLETFGVGVGIGGIVVGAILAWTFYRRHESSLERNQKSIEILESLFIAQFQILDDNPREPRRGKIVKNPDGTYGVAWELKLEERFTASATVQAKDP